MGIKTGDKGRQRRMRQRKLARRVEMRALRKESTSAAAKNEAKPEAETAS